MVLLVVAAVIAYWYIFVSLVVVATSVWLIYRSRKKNAEEEKLRHRAGPRDPWLNEIAVSLAEFEFSEYARNTGSQVAGVPIEGDVRLDAPRFSVIITLLATAELARQADFALRAKPEMRSAIADGKLLIRTEGRILYTANGLGGPVDESRLNEVAQIVGGIAIGPLRAGPPTRPVKPVSSPAVSAASKAPARPRPPPVSVPAPEIQHRTADLLDQIQRLATLRDSGALTESEFQEKKEEILRRL